MPAPLYTIYLVAGSWQRASTLRITMLDTWWIIPGTQHLTVFPLVQNLGPVDQSRKKKKRLEHMPAPLSLRRPTQEASGCMDATNGWISAGARIQFALCRLALPRLFLKLPSRVESIIIISSIDQFALSTLPNVTAYTAPTMYCEYNQCHPPQNAIR